MATPAQLDANRSNAQLSTGPRTDEGKRITRENATTHGMTSKHVVLPHEDVAEWETVRDGYIKVWAPANDLERALTVAVAETWWRLRRQRRIESALMQQRTQALCETNPNLDGDAALAMLMSDPAEMKRMALMLRYVNSAERAHSKAIRELEQVQKLRRAAEHDTADQTRPESVLQPRAETKPIAPRAGTYNYYPTVPPRIPDASDRSSRP